MILQLTLKTMITFLLACCNKKAYHFVISSITIFITLNNFQCLAPNKTGQFRFSLIRMFDVGTKFQSTHDKSVQNGSNGKTIPCRAYERQKDR